MSSRRYLLSNPWRFSTCHRLVVLRAFGAVIQLRITERDVEGAVAHPLFDHFQGGSSIEELRGKGMPQRIGRIGLLLPASFR